MTTTNCPICGAVINLEPGRPGRLVGRCACHPAGPVIEVSAPSDEGAPSPGAEGEGAGAGLGGEDDLDAGRDGIDLGRVGQ